MCYSQPVVTSRDITCNVSTVGETGGNWTNQQLIAVSVRTMAWDSGEICHRRLEWASSSCQRDSVQLNLQRSNRHWYSSRWTQFEVVCVSERVNGSTCGHKVEVDGWKISDRHPGDQEYRYMMIPVQKYYLALVRDQQNCVTEFDKLRNDE